MSKLVGNHTYDVLDYHSEKFKKPSKEFEPRIKNNSKAESHLQKSSYYQPPRRRKKKNIQINEQENNIDNDDNKSTFRKSFDNKTNTSIVDETINQKKINKNNSSLLNESNLLNSSTTSNGLKRTVEKYFKIFLRYFFNFI